MGSQERRSVRRPKANTLIDLSQIRNAAHCVDKRARGKTIYFCDVGRIGAGPKGNAHLQYSIFHCADVES